MIIAQFHETVREYFESHGRVLPWRTSPSPYNVLVSEMMLQQTQVERVIPKFEQFVARFPNVEILAESSLADVLVMWQGLGYNRRAKFLHAAAKEIVRQGGFPETRNGLEALPGIGPNTAGAIMVYAHNHVDIFVETNIRTVYFHHFFADESTVSDAEIVAKVAATMPMFPSNDSAEKSGELFWTPRTWYSALMDYGTALKKQGFGKIAKSTHYRKQSAFEGSIRQLRGRVVRALTEGPQSLNDLCAHTGSDDRMSRVLASLENEGIIEKTDNTYRLRH